MTTLAAPAAWADTAFARLGAYHVKAAGAAEPATVLAGRLSVSKSGWGLLSVPNALARGLFDALDEPGCELPPGSRGGPFNAHISVIRPEELARIGGPDRLTERGHTFRYQLGRVETVEPAGWAGMSRVWFTHVDSPALVRLRRSYGLSDLPDNNTKPFHLTFAVRRKHVLRAGEAGVKGREPGEEPVSPFKDGDPGAKTAALPEGYALSEWLDDEDPAEPLTRYDLHHGGKNVAYLTSHPAAEGGVWLKGLRVEPDHRGKGLARRLVEAAIARHPGQELRLRPRPYGDKPLSAEDLTAFYGRLGFEPYDAEGRMVRPVSKAARDREPFPPDWKEPADREDCPSCGVMHERDNGRCNACGEVWPAKTAAGPDVYIIRGNPDVDPGHAAEYDAFYDAIKRHVEELGHTAAFDPGLANTVPPGGKYWLGHSRGADRLRFAEAAGARPLRLDDYEPAAARAAQDAAYRTLFEELGVSRIADVPVARRPLPGPEHYTFNDEMKAAITRLLTPPPAPVKTAALVSEDELRESGRKLLAKGKAAVEAVLEGLDEEEADGLYCYFHPDQGLWVDVCDWGDPDAGERVVRAFCEAAGLEDEGGERPNPFVRAENEAAKPGTGWERLG